MQRSLLIPVLCAVGCFRPPPDYRANGFADLSSPTISAAAESSLYRLLKTPADPAHAISSGHAVQAIPIRSMQALASDAARYTLYIDQPNHTAWIDVSGGIADHLNETIGPWPLENLDVQQLIQSSAEESKTTVGDSERSLDDARSR